MKFLHNNITSIADGEANKALTFNELCEKVVADEINNFNLVIEEADGIEGGYVEIALVDEYNSIFHRILKALTNLLNKLFAFFRRLSA